MKKILLADQQPVTRIGLGHWLRELLQSESLELCESNNAEQLLTQLKSGKCDVVILDLDLDQHDGIELIKKIRRQYNEVAILVFTAHPEHRYGVRALRAGAMGYVSKLSSKETVLRAIRKALQGQHFISQELSEQLAQQVTGRRGQAGYVALSDREYQIASMIARGLTASRIASELSLSVKTIHTHRARGLKKLGLRNNAELTHYAFRNGLVD